MRAATVAFERAWYGDRPTGAAEGAAFQQAAQQALGAVDAASRRREADRSPELVESAP